MNLSVGAAGGSNNRKLAVDRGVVEFMKVFEGEAEGGDKGFGGIRGFGMEDLEGEV